MVTACQEAEEQLGNNGSVAMLPFYYDPERYDSYLEQLGIEYPTVREE